MYKELLRYVSIVDALAHGSLGNPGITYAESRKIKKHHGFIDYGYFFQSVAQEVHVSSGDIEVFITRPSLCKMLCRSHEKERAQIFLNFKFLKQQISRAVQIGKAACVLRTVTERHLNIYKPVCWEWVSRLQLEVQLEL